MTSLGAARRLALIPPPAAPREPRLGWSQRVPPSPAGTRTGGWAALGESWPLTGGRVAAAMEPRSMEYFGAQVQQKDVGGRLQVGQELLLYLRAPGAILDLEEDLGSLRKTIDALTGWVGSSNYRVSGGGGAAGLDTPSPPSPLIPDVRGLAGLAPGCA